METETTEQELKIMAWIAVVSFVFFEITIFVNIRSIENEAKEYARWHDEIMFRGLCNAYPTLAPYYRIEYQVKWGD